MALGALAGGCNFISSYPMSPSTGVLIHLAKQAHAHGVVVEQAEDEISAINMALGSWYAGGRALVSTSGGGFDLMAEGLSLAGIIESPLVIHLAQRPGPGTGLPTRTEQGDLEIARYAGHGEFPRAILAPGSPEEAFACAARAYVGHPEETRAILKAAIQHRGYALVDLLQPCVTFNKLNTYQWFEAHTAPLPDDHDPGDRMQAFARACEDDPLRLGIFYRKEKPVFEEQLVAYADDPRPLFERRVDLDKLAVTMRELG